MLQHYLSWVQHQNREASPCIRPQSRKARVDHAGNGWSALHWDVNPTLIGITLAEIAEIAEIAGDADPMPIGVTLAETAETPANRVMRKRVGSRQEVTALQSPCF
jgi:hypothetical protein